MKIRNKLFLLVVLVVIVFSASVATTISMIQKVKIGSDLYIEVRTFEDFLKKTALLKSDLNQVRAILLTFLEVRGETEIEKLFAEISDTSARIDANFDDILKGAKDEEFRRFVLGARDAWHLFRDTRNREIIPAVYAGNLARARELAFGIQKERYEKFINFLTQAVEVMRRRIDGIEKKVAQEINKNIKAYAARGLVFVISIFILVAWLGSSITRPIRHLMETAKKVAGGDFSVEVEIAGRDEIGELAGSFNQMTHDLSRLMEDERKLAAASATLAAERTKSGELEKAYFELARSQQKYKDLVDNLSVAVYRNTLDPEGYFLEVNPAMSAIFDAKSADEFFKLHLSDLFGDKTKALDFTEKLIRMNSVKGEELELVTLGGKAFWASLTAVLKRDEKGVHSYGIIQDISEHKRMELRLLEERERLSKIAASMGAGLCLLDKSFRIVWLNETMEKWFGRACDIQGKFCYATYQFREMVCDDPCPLKDVLASGQSLSAEKRVHFPDGRVMDFLFVCSPFRNELGEVDQVLELVLDITERKRIVELLEYERALSRNVIDSINDALVVLDSRNRSIIDVNRQFMDFYGVKKEDVVGKGLSDLSFQFCPCDDARFDEVLRSGQAVTLTHNCQRPDGRPIFLDMMFSPLRDEKNRIIGVIVLSRDITDRVRLEEDLKRYSETLESLVKERTKALQKSELMFRKLFESAHDGIFIIDYETGRVIDVNPSLLSLLESSREACIGLDCRRMSCFSDSVFFEKLFDELKHKIFASYDGLPLKTASGREIFVEVRASLYFVEEKKIFECHIRDVTERMRMEKVKTEFVSMVSHELRTPLSAIKEGVEIVADGTQGKINKAQNECLGIALSNINRLNRLVGDILDISKIQSNLLVVKSVPLSVRDIIEYVYGLVKIEIENRGMLLVTDIEKELPPISGDKDRVVQVLMNLLNNAIKFTRAKSRITLSCRRVSSFAEFVVSDEGAGIPETELSRLFGKFVQLDSTLVRRAGGTGLGLYISRNLVEAMGGRIWAESKLGEGSTFRFTIPLAGGAA